MCVCFTSTKTVWLIRDGGRLGEGIRAQAHLLLHIASEVRAQSLVSKHGAVRPQKPKGLLGTGEEGKRLGRDE